MGEFEFAFRELNEKQRHAAMTIFGPVLVIAGPGTGKTQLISTRVGYILQETDTLPQNILCLTFTEAGASAMRERLISLLGQSAYDIRISTYHAFGSELLRNYPEYIEQPDMEPADEVARVEILNDIIQKLPYSDPLKYASSYLGDIIGFISDAKRALLTPKDIIKTAEDNLKFLELANRDNQDALAQLVAINKKSVPLLESIHQTLQQIDSGKFKLTRYCKQSLDEALQNFSTSGKTTALTKWKNKWLAKDNDGQFIFDGKRTNLRLLSAGQIYQKYQDELKKRQMFDFDDMILRAIEALEKNPDFKYTLAEQFQFLMLDEFQDTNPAQMHLIELLTDHPVNEGRPNILAVGDDDQAIYAFQGADHANMTRFLQNYKDVKIVSLQDNYRSHKEILEVSSSISEQIGDRLHRQLDGTQKVLVASNKSLPKTSTVAAHKFKSDAAEYAWIASEIKRLVDEEKIPLSEIAVLAPKHKYLAPLLPFLASAKLPVRYEKRENILDLPLVQMLTQMVRLVMALAADNHPLANSLWPEVMSYDFWNLSTRQIWQASLAASFSKASWTEVLLGERATEQVALFLLSLKDASRTQTLEELLDKMIGNPLTTEGRDCKSPFFEYYFGRTARGKSIEFMNLLSNLSLLRSRLRQWKRDENRPLNLEDFTQFVDAYRAAGINILNTNPYYEADDSINILTAYGAKGREFQAVFVLDCADEVWGSASRNQGNRLSLPANLEYIRYRGASEDERLRLFFVAITRAKTHLYLTCYDKTLAGKAVTPLKYLNAHAFLSSHLQKVLEQQIDSTALTLEAAQNYWAVRHRPPFNPRLRTLLAARLKQYRLSATHLNQFIDVANGGPQQFFLEKILRFPHAPIAATSYGNAVHETLRWVGQSLEKDKKLPNQNRCLKYFEKRLASTRLGANDFKLYLMRGQDALKAWQKERPEAFKSGDIYEHNFQYENVVLGDILLTGKIDHLRLDTKRKTIIITDFKTGQPYPKWDKSNVSLHKYRQQLLVYKLLVENSTRFAGYKVTKACLEFIEPDDNAKIITLEMNYDDSEIIELKKLLNGVWKRIQNLDFADTSEYPQTIAGIRAFEKDLLG